MSIEYIRSGDYYIPDLKLPEENRPIGKWGRMHRDYLKEHIQKVPTFTHHCECGHLHIHELLRIKKVIQQNMADFSLPK